MTPKPGGRPTARPKVAEQASISEKIEFVAKGDNRDAEAWSLIEGIIQFGALEMAAAKTGAPPFGDDVVREHDRAAGELIRKAVLNKDTSFFDHCGRALDWFLRGKPDTDFLALRILDVIRNMAIDWSRPAPIRRSDILKGLTEKFPNLKNTGGITIRRITGQLGLSLPLDVADLRERELMPQLRKWDRSIQMMYKNALELFRAGRKDVGEALFYEGMLDGKPYAAQQLAAPVWDGSPVQGQRILVRCPQEFDHSIRFIRYARPIAERGGEVVIECPRQLVELFRSAKGVREVVAAGDSLPDVDFQISMVSLPLLFQTTSETIPREIPYLSPDPTRSKKWLKRLRPRAGRLRVGLMWSGMSKETAHFKPYWFRYLIGLENIEFFSLQGRRGSKQLWQMLGSPTVVDRDIPVKDFADSAAFLWQLDLIISVDSAVAHLAGALGRPAWVLLPFYGKWGWGAEEMETPWYPTLRPFRRSPIDGWLSTMRSLTAELKSFAERERQSGTCQGQ